MQTVCIVIRTESHIHKHCIKSITLAHNNTDRQVQIQHYFHIPNLNLIIITSTQLNLIIRIPNRVLKLRTDEFYDCMKMFIDIAFDDT